MSMTRQAFIVFCLLLPHTAFAADPPKPAWEKGNTTDLKGLKVHLSKPVLVARSHGYLWFPTLTRLANGDLLALMSNYHDDHVKNATAMLSWSRDGGLTWTAPREGLYADTSVRLPNGDQLLIPYYLHPGKDGTMTAPFQLNPKGKQEVEVKEGLTVAGWPRPDQPISQNLNLSGFVFNGGTVELQKGGYLATLYGHFKDTKRYALVAAESSDGKRWKIRSTIADENCKLKGGEGPCEAATCRLQDGRLMCVFRLASNVPYGQVWSSDEGKTWTEPVAIEEASSVQPGLAVMKDGMVVLSGGRPGVYLWFHPDGTGKGWQRVDLMANHNTHRPDDAIKNPAAGGNTSSYTEVVALNDNQFLCIYDRIPHGWKAIPKDSTDTNSVWVVRVTVERAEK